ncbi:MAG: DNA repair protein RecN [Chlamydiae bacterium]|nr:DNA repair protein RecN [Chlamydiota bacterium]
MIETLRIKNLILIELCEIRFDKGLTIITGETGAGKTAFTEGLSLLLGQRADPSLVRKGEEKAHVDATFDISGSTKILSILEEQGIEICRDEPLIITRELSKEGKSRAFINRQPVTVATLQSVGRHLIDIIGQHSYHTLKSQETLREIIDLYGNLESQGQSFTAMWNRHKQCTKDLNILSTQLLEKERSYEGYIEELTEIKEAKLQEHEEQELFELFSFQMSTRDIAQQCKEISQTLSEGPRPLLREIAHHKHILENLSSVHLDFSEQAELMHQALIALQEVDHSLQKTLSTIDGDQISTSAIEQRLSIYGKIKKKYGPTFVDWSCFEKKLSDQIQKWEILDEEIDQAKDLVKGLAICLDEQGQELTVKRKQAAILLQEHLSHSLQELNMPGARVLIEILPQERSLSGDDHIAVWLQANQGEKPSSIKDSTSGGELSRLLLAIKTTLAEKNNTPTMLFDEIDANVGGTTASLIGDRLRELSKHRQVFCITHFPQVAKKAHLHLRVYKQTINQRTVGMVEHIDHKERATELLRMLGGDKVILSLSPEEL